ncbi:MAG: hypothetical protein IH571_01505, partial [Acholeplasmataceae bacterium]|nr:hypothetical protein [Acholeplasmataceae bacterium]
MPVVQMGNGYYFLYLIVGVLATIGIIKLLKKKSRGYRHWFLFGVLMASFFVHFIKVIFYPYTTLDYPFRRATFENICAVNTVLFPLVYLTKSKVLKDYMIMSGIFSGLVAFIIPVNAFSEYFDGILLGYQSAFSIEIIRFYFNHLILFLVPFVLMYYKMHTISYKRAYKTILVFFGVLVLIFINELIITALGWVPRAMLF